MGPKRAIVKPKVNDDNDEALQNNNLVDARRLGLLPDDEGRNKSKVSKKRNKDGKNVKNNESTSSTTNERKQVVELVSDHEEYEEVNQVSNNFDSNRSSESYSEENIDKESDIEFQLSNEISERFDPIAIMFNHLNNGEDLPEEMKALSDLELTKTFCVHQDIKKYHNLKIMKDNPLNEALRVMNKFGFNVKDGWKLHGEFPLQFLPLKYDKKETVHKKLQLAHYVLLCRNNYNQHEAFLQQMEYKVPEQLDMLITAAYTQACMQTSLKVLSPNHLTEDRLEPRELDEHGNDLPTTPIVNKQQDVVNDDIAPTHGSVAKRGLFAGDGHNVYLSGEKIPHYVPPHMAIIDQQLAQAYEAVDRNNMIRNNDALRNTTTVQVVSSKNINHLICESTVTREKMLMIINHATSEIHSSRPFDFRNHIIGTARDALANLLAVKKKLKQEDLDDTTWWDRISQGELLIWLKEIYKDKDSTTNVSTKTLIKEAIEKQSTKFVCNVTQLQSFKTTIAEPLQTIMLDYGDVVDTDDVLFNLLIKKLKALKPPDNKNSEQVIKLLKEDRELLRERPDKPPLRFQHTVYFIQKVVETFINQLSHVQEFWGISDISNLIQKGSTISKKESYDNHSSDTKPTSNKTSYSKDEPPKKKTKHNNDNRSDTKKSDKLPKERMLCNGCGHGDHEFDKCPYKNHPDYNKSGEWRQSTARAKLMETFPNKKPWEIRLHKDFRTDGKTRTSSSDDKGSKKPYGEKCKLLSIDTIYKSEYSVPIDNDLYLISSSVQTGIDTLLVDTLIDSGASANYISEEVAAWIMGKQEDNLNNHSCKLSSREANIRSTSVLASTEYTITSSGLAYLVILYFLMN